MTSPARSFEDALDELNRQVPRRAPRLVSLTEIVALIRQGRGVIL